MSLPSDLPLDAEVSFIPMGDVSEDGEWRQRQTRKLLEVQSGFTAFREGDVLFAKITPCMENGKGAHVVGLQHGIGFGSTEFHVLRARPGVSSRYVHHLAQSPRLRIAAEAHMIGSAGQQRVQKQFFDRYSIPGLPLAEQDLIAQILDTLDTQIRQTEALIAKLEQIKQGMLTDLLTRGIGENGQLRPPPEQAPHLYKDSPLGRVPREWVLEELGDQAHVTVGFVGTTSRFYTTADKGVIFLRTGNITPKGLDTTDVRWIAPEFHAANPKSALLPGDVVVSRVGYTGNAAVVPSIGQANCANMIIIRRGGALEPRYLRLLFSSNVIVAQVAGFTIGSAQPVLNINLVKRLLCLFPSLPEQQRIVNAFDTIERRVEGEESIKAELKSMKASLMDDLLTGRVRQA
jgi:type I restriction enzyme S subunit